MPRIPEKLLDSVFYLYPQVEDARSGKNFGGTGFLCFVPSTSTGDGQHLGWLYAITNWHVAVRDGHSVVRVNSLQGEPDILDYGPEDWDFDPRFDLAVLRLGNSLSLNKHKIAAISPEMFCSRALARDRNVGPGDEVFMAGRFVDHDGGVTNIPAVRFGHLSVNPTPMAQGPAGSSQPCFCVDVHSRTGYSGSPVFIYRTAGNSLDDALERQPTQVTFVTGGTRLFMLLGIHFAQFPEMWKLEQDSGAQDQTEAALISRANQEYVEGMSGMTCVLPAWHIAEVLNMPKLVKDRGGKIVNLGPVPVQGPAGPKDESSSPSTEANPKHREDFNSLVDAAVRKPKQDDQT